LIPAAVLKTLHEPGCALGAKFIPLKTPNEKSAAITTAIMRIAQPYQ
jgi:hypothetical protein